MVINEQFLYFIWQFRLYDPKSLICEGGEALEIIHPGILNSHAGPDFSKASIRISGTHWVGNVEIHISSSDWYLHRHEQDESYESVILHVVYELGQPVSRGDGSTIPVLELKGRLSPVLLGRYEALLRDNSRLPCAGQIRLLDRIVIESTLSRMIAERFEHKSAEVLDRLRQLKGNWDETFYFFMAKSFGFHVNVVPFEMLAISLSSRVFAKHKNRPFQIEALIFGQAGFLKADFTESYPMSLYLEYTFLRKKYRLQPIAVSNWKFLRMRPQNFPTIRLAQFSAFVARSNHLFSKILEMKNVQDVVSLFEDLPVNPYWRQHYHFNKPTKHVNLLLGRASIQNIIINTVCQLLFSYGKFNQDLELVDRAFQFLAALPAERNAVVDEYVSSGVRPDNAMMSQAILQLNKYYCSQKKCLNCGIGIKILNR